MSDIQFVDGLRMYAPNERAPDFIVANGVLDRDALTAWLASRDPQVRIVIKRSQGGKLYAAVDAYKRETEAERKPAPNPQRASAPAKGFEDDDIPF